MIASRSPRRSRSSSSPAPGRWRWSISARSRRSFRASFSSRRTRIFHTADLLADRIDHESCSAFSSLVTTGSRKIAKSASPASHAPSRAAGPTLVTSRRSSPADAVLLQEMLRTSPASAGPLCHKLLAVQHRPFEIVDLGLPTRGRSRRCRSCAEKITGLSADSLL